MPAPTQPQAAALPKSERQKIAAAFLKTAQWGILGMRGTRVQDKPAPEKDASRVTMRVFAKGCPAHALREALEALAAATPVQSFVADGMAQPGEWHHRAAWWARDAQSSRSGDATLTLFREMSDGPVTETNVVEDGCGSRTTIRFVWDASEVEDISGIDNAGDQGFAVRIAGVNRDSETGLFSYYVTTTERKTLVWGPQVVSEDYYRKVEVQSWEGVRGSLDSPTDDEGGSITLPTSGITTESEGGGEGAVTLGVTTEVTSSRDPGDCTLDVEAKVEKRTPRFLEWSVTDTKGSRRHRNWWAQAPGYGTAQLALVTATTKEQDISIGSDGLEDGSFSAFTEAWDDGEDTRWDERRSYVEKLSSPSQTSNLYDENSALITPPWSEGGSDAWGQPPDGYAWRWVFELTKIKIRSTDAAASGWASPYQFTTYPCLPGSGSTPLGDGRYIAKRVVARKYSYWYNCSESAINTQAKYDAVIASLTGVGDLEFGGPGPEEP